MPDAAPPSPLTTTYVTQNWRQQVVAQLAAASLPAAATEGRVYADTTNDRLTFDTGAALVPGPNWSSTGRVGFHVTDATNRSIATGTGTYTALTFSTEVSDAQGFFTAGGTTFTVPTGMGGLYVGELSVTWASSPGANSVVTLIVNSTTTYMRLPVTAATQMLVTTVPIFVPLAAGNTLQVLASQGSGGAININPSRFQLWRFAA